MKTEQEQIGKMSNIITDCLRKNCKNCKYYNGHFCPDPMTGRAEALINAGYGDVSEYKAEIERLKEENDTNMQYIRMMGIQSHIKTSNERVKQAKIDVLNELRERITKDRVANDTVVINVNYEIKELIKEVQDETR